MSYTLVSRYIRYGWDSASEYGNFLTYCSETLGIERTEAAQFWAEAGNYYKNIASGNADRVRPSRVSWPDNLWRIRDQLLKKKRKTEFDNILVAYIELIIKVYEEERNDKSY